MPLSILASVSTSINCVLFTTTQRLYIVCRFIIFVTRIRGQNTPYAPRRSLHLAGLPRVSFVRLFPLKRHACSLFVSQSSSLSHAQTHCIIPLSSTKPISPTFHNILTQLYLIIPHPTRLPCHQKELPKSSTPEDLINHHTYLKDGQLHEQLRHP